MFCRPIWLALLNGFCQLGLPSEAIARLRAAPSGFRHDLHAFFRKERNLTQKALAAACDMHATYIQRYESGETQPTLDAIRRLALALSSTPSNR
ncbi:helix-turn-helix domain-containing protein [Hyphococcus sp.]|uniref:helix-turn-helix domain-containing protein n=1 Tax=Hyphococcus sp. TaxID=2038636 RepID=UPI003752ACDD